MAKAVWNGGTVAEADEFQEVEGNVYFPLASVNKEFLQPSDYHTTCPWKGQANYYHIEVDGKVNENAAWYYPEPKEAAKDIKDHVAFWKGVHVER